MRWMITEWAARSGSCKLLQKRQYERRSGQFIDVLHQLMRKQFSFLKIKGESLKTKFDSYGEKLSTRVALNVPQKLALNIKKALVDFLR